MKSLLLKSIFLTLVLGVMASYSAVAQRVIKGTVYRDGKVAAGVTVEAHKSSEKFMTSFDGLYEIKVPSNSKYLKFTFIDESKRVDLENNPNNVIDFSFDGKIPEAAQASEEGAVLKTLDELKNEGNKDFMGVITLEKQFYDQKNYKSALPLWRTLYRKYPKSTINIYIHGANIYQSLIDSAKNQKLKAAYVDTLMQVYDKRIKYFNKKGEVLQRQAIDYMRYMYSDYMLGNVTMTDQERKPILTKGYAYLEESVKLQGNETESPVLILLMQATRELYRLGEMSKEKVIENYDIASGIVNQALKKNATDSDFLLAKDNIDQIFQTSGAADCEALISIYTPKFDQIASNVEDLKKMIRMLDRQGCDASPLYGRASEKLYQMEPSAEAAYSMARTFVKANNHDRAEEYYKQAISLEKDPMNLSNYYFEIATLNFADSPQEAKGYLRKSIDNNPNFGKAYFWLAELYANNSKSVGADDYERSLVFLVAVDYLNKAKKADPSLAEDANKKINTYSQYFPPKEEIFFRGLTEGQSITVGGWIGESTTIRAAKK